MGKINLSVIIATYNRGDIILNSVNSALGQSYKNIEVIVVDDGSTDDTKAKISNIHDKRVKYLYVSHSGLPSKTRNMGIKISKGKWIAFLDSDDIWHSDKLKCQLDFMDKGKFEISCTNAKVLGSRKREKMHTNMPNYLYYENLAETNWVICSSVVLSRSLLDKISYFPEDISYRAFEDWILWMRLSTTVNIGVLDESLLSYTDNPTQSIRSGMTLETSKLNMLRTDIISWGFKKIAIHPSRLRLLKNMWLACKYIYLTQESI